MFGANTNSEVWCLLKQQGFIQMETANFGANEMQTERFGGKVNSKLWRKCKQQCLVKM